MYVNDKCLFTDICDCFDSDSCNYMCRWFSRFDYMIRVDDSGIPKSMQNTNKLDMKPLYDKSKRDYEILGHIKSHPDQFVAKGASLYIYGNTGNGKSSIAAKIAMNYMYFIAFFGGDIDNVVKFVNVSEFIDYQYSHKDDTEFLDKIKTCTLLILDDICTRDYAPFVADMLDTIIRYRNNNCLSTIYTSNVSVDDIKDDRLSSLLCQAIQIHMVGPDRRINKMSADDVIKYLGGDV